MLRKQLFTIALCFGFSAAFSQEVCNLFFLGLELHAAAPDSALCII